PLRSTMISLRSRFRLVSPVRFNNTSLKRQRTTAPSFAEASGLCCRNTYAPLDRNTCQEAVTLTAVVRLLQRVRGGREIARLRRADDDDAVGVVRVHDYRIALIEPLAAKRILGPASGKLRGTAAGPEMGHVHVHAVGRREGTAAGRVDRGPGD